MLRRALCLFPLVSLLLSGPTARAQAPWVGTWAAAPSAETLATGALPEEHTWREIVHVSRGGYRARVTLTNELGTDSLLIGGAHLGVPTEGGRLQPGSDRALTFGGQPTITIPPGAVAVSDPVAMPIARLSDLAVTLLIPAQPLHTLTTHPLALQTSYDATGDELNSPELTGATPFANWRLLKNVEVASTPDSATVATLGDSITDGYRSTPGTNGRWPDVLAARLQADKHLKAVGVLNEGISGGRILHNGAGPNALARFDRDILSQDGVRYLILLEGINDIGRTDEPREPTDKITTEQLIVGMKQIIERAHAHGIKVYGATLTPFLGAGYSSPAGEAMRQALNTWIRTGGRFDAVIDFDKVVRDPAHPDKFLPTMDSGDNLHPGDAGYKAMGDSIDLSLFAR